MSPVFAGTVSLCLSQGPSAWLDSRLLGSTEARGYTDGTACGLLAFRISFHLSIQRCPTPLLCYRSHFLPHSSLTSALPPQLSSFGPSSSPTPPKRKFPQKNPPARIPGSRGLLAHSQSLLGAMLITPSRQAHSLYLCQYFRTCLNRQEQATALPKPRLPLAYVCPS